MTVNIGTNANINQERLKQQTDHPASPASGYELLYIISGSPHGGLFLKDSAGRQIGPFITGTSGGASTSWQAGSMTWYVNGSLVTLHASSVQRYKVVDSNLIMIEAVLAAANGVNLNGVLEIRDLPFEPANTIVSTSVLGHAIEQDEGNEYKMSSVYHYDTGKLRFKRYDTFNDSSWNVVGNSSFNSADKINFQVFYEI